MNGKPKSDWGVFKSLLVAVACLVLLVALFYAEEDWRGWHAWHNFQRQWEAKGEKFDRQSAVPAPVPDDQNFALAQVVAGSYSYILDRNGHEITPRRTNEVDRLKMEIPPAVTNGIGYWQKSSASQLQSPADDVLRALGKYDSTIEELRAAAQLPYSRFPLNYDTENPAMIYLPHLADLKRCSQVLQLRAVAELQNGQSEKALADVRLALQLADKVRTEPILISHLVRLAILQITLQPVWDGLARHQWSDAQLAALDAELAKLNFAADYQLSLRNGELVLMQGGVFDYLRRHPEQLPALSGQSRASPPLSARILLRLIPSGWIYQNQLRCARPMEEFLLPVADTNQQTISPAKAKAADAAVTAQTRRPGLFNLGERLLLPALGNVGKRFAYGQASADLARVAIALERYRLAHGDYPAALDALAPQFIEKVPHDVVNRQPLHYRRPDDGQFVLYSIGWNEMDDDGEVGLKTDGTVDRDTGDWVWRYP